MRAEHPISAYKAWAVVAGGFPQEVEVEKKASQSHDLDREKSLWIKDKV